MAETLNRYGIHTYYIYLGQESSGHDSTRFHFGRVCKNWDLSWVPRQDHSDLQKIIQRLAEIRIRYDILYCLATGMNAYLLRACGIPYKYWSYGSDLDQHCFVRTNVQTPLLMRRLLVHPYRVYSEMKRTRKSILLSDTVMISPYQLDMFRKLSSRQEMFFLPHHFRVADYEEVRRGKAENRRQIGGMIGAERFFFSTARHVWAGPLKRMKDNKGNDVILRAYSRYLELTRDFDSKLLLIAKGPDVNYSKALAKGLGIEKQTMWLPEMKREELDRYYQGATLCLGQFGTPALTFSILESLANGTGGISLFLGKDHSVPFYAEDPPVFNSEDPEDIANFMGRISHNAKEEEEWSYQSWRWIDTYCSERKFVNSFVNLFERDHSLKTECARDGREGKSLL
jgi:hypothetical protein